METTISKKKCVLCKKEQDVETFRYDYWNPDSRSDYCDECRTGGGLKPDEKHLIIREAYRHYLDLFDAYKREGIAFIEHMGLVISILDLKRVLESVDLSGRKSQAFVLNVLQDQKQWVVAETMGICTVSVGQYVIAACRQLSDLYWSSDEWLNTGEKFDLESSLPDIQEPDTLKDVSSNGNK